MKIPQSQNLHSQSFNFKFIEFVWQFPLIENIKNQIIFKCYEDGTILLEEGPVGDDGELCDYCSNYSTSGIISTKNISMEELVQLRNDVIEYLKSI